MVLILLSQHLGGKQNLVAVVGGLLHGQGLEHVVGWLLDWWLNNIVRKTKQITKLIVFSDSFADVEQGRNDQQQVGLAEGSIHGIVLGDELGEEGTGEGIS